MDIRNCEIMRYYIHKFRPYDFLDNRFVFYLQCSLFCSVTAQNAQNAKEHQYSEKAPEPGFRKIQRSYGASGSVRKMIFELFNNR